MSFWEWSSQVPATVYVGVLGFVGTTLTIYFNNKATATRFRQQIIEDREKETRKRLIESRREVFMAAVDCAALGITVIGQMSDLTRPLGEITAPFIAASGAIAKTHIFASYETSEALIRAARGIGSAIVELTVERTELDSLSHRITSLSGTGAAVEEVQQLGRERMVKQFVFGEVCIARSTGLMPLMADAVNAICRDLGVDHEDGRFKALVTEQALEQKAHFGAAMWELRRRFGVGPTPPPPPPPGLQLVS